MTSPIETPPPVTPPTSPVTESSDLVIGGTRIPLPRWARLLVGLLAIFAAAIPVLLALGGLPASQLTSMVKAAPSPTPTPAPTPDPEIAFKVSEAQMRNYRESEKHSNESPRRDKVIYDSPDLGILRVKFFISDRCLQVIRTSAGENPQTMSQYIVAAKMEDQAPGKIASAWLSKDSVVDSDSFDGQMEPASFPPRAAAAAVAPSGSCMDPHGGAFRWWNGQNNGCWLQIWRAWPDGCQHYQWFNTCNNFWDNHPNGAPRVYWTSCVH